MVAKRNADSGGVDMLEITELSPNRSTVGTSWHEIKLPDQAVGVLYATPDTKTFVWKGVIAPADLNLSKIDELVVLMTGTKRGRVRALGSMRMLMQAKQSSDLSLDLGDPTQAAVFERGVVALDTFLFLRLDVCIPNERLCAFTIEEPANINALAPVHLTIQLARQQQWSTSLAEWIVSHHATSWRANHHGRWLDTNSIALDSADLSRAINTIDSSPGVAYG